jgi:tetratricopeptide (TPR) repeat protein
LDLVVIGAEELPLDDYDLLDDSLRRAVAEGKLEVIQETELWRRLGLVECERHVRQLYTPAMLADLLDVPVSIIRRWHRRGLIVPFREVHRLPYFDFQEVATARQLARLLAAGATPHAIEAKLEQLARYVPDVDRPLAQLSVIVEGRQLLLRQGEGLVEPSGQRRFDFAALDGERPDGVGEEPSLGELPVSGPLASDSHAAILKLTHGGPTTPGNAHRRDEFLATAMESEDLGEPRRAIEGYRTLLLMYGPDADVSFRLAELLYRLGDTTAALERYYMAIEIDEDFVEARANLGCVLLELGQPELAVAAFHGALERHPDYPDVHYHLACTLEDLGHTDEAFEHWREFLSLAPDSPWSNEARERLGLTT